jgi:hypothetical protein
MKYLISVVVTTGNNVFENVEAYRNFCLQIPKTQPFVDVEAMTALFKGDGRIVDNGSNITITGNIVTNLRVFRDEDSLTEWKVLWEPYRSQFEAIFEIIGWTFQCYERAITDIGNEEVVVS